MSEIVEKLKKWACSGDFNVVLLLRYLWNKLQQFHHKSVFNSNESWWHCNSLITLLVCDYCRISNILCLWYGWIFHKFLCCFALTHPYSSKESTKNIIHYKDLLTDNTDRSQSFRCAHLVVCPFGLVDYDVIGNCKISTFPVAHIWIAPWTTFIQKPRSLVSYENTISKAGIYQTTFSFLKYNFT